MRFPFDKNKNTQQPPHLQTQLSEVEEQHVLRELKQHIPPSPDPHFGERLRQKLKESVLKRRRQRRLMKWGSGVAVTLLLLMLLTPIGKEWLHNSLLFVQSFFQKETEQVIVIPDFPDEAPPEENELPHDDDLLVPIIQELETVISEHDYLQSMRHILEHTIDLHSLEGTPEYHIASRSFVYYHAALAAQDIELLKRFTWGSERGYPTLNYDERISYYHEVMVKETLEIVSIRPSMAEPDFWITLRYQDHSGDWYTTEYILTNSYVPSIYSVLDETLTNHQPLVRSDQQISVSSEDVYIKPNQHPVTIPVIEYQLNRQLDFELETVNQALEATFWEAANKVLSVDDAYPEEEGEIWLSYIITHDTYPLLSIAFHSSVTFPSINQGRTISFNTYIIYDLEANHTWTVENILKDISIPVTDEDEYAYTRRLLSYFDQKYQQALELSTERYLEGYFEDPAAFTFNEVQQVYLEEGEVSFYIGDFIYGVHGPKVFKLHELKHLFIAEEFLEKLY